MKRTVLRSAGERKGCGCGVESVRGAGRQSEAEAGRRCRAVEVIGAENKGMQV